MSVTKGQLEAQNAELQTVVKNLEKMNLEAMALARRARNDTDDADRAARHFKQQRDRLIGFLQGYRRDIDKPLRSESGAMSYQPETIEVSHVDAFLDDCREDPELINTAERRRL